MVTVHILSAAGTFEQRLDEILASKRDLAKDFDKAGLSWVSEFTDEQQRQLFKYSAPEERPQGEEPGGSPDSGEAELAPDEPPRKRPRAESPEAALPSEESFGIVSLFGWEDPLARRSL